ncbi:transitional endoplasmic reticulum ATPase [Hyalella azteca]|uniref:Transitional endoplasmic reticulum ATPase n=1 Tax=Hyalella azteca TaxID=294128 RepID=A0A8B7NQM6_HYAAZ|nr:transitional endoplasmic reticulum ATPase [Hyalella azteca]
MPNYHYDIGPSIFMCECHIKHTMKPRSSPWIGHPFLFTKSSKLQLRTHIHFTITAISAAPNNCQHSYYTLKDNGIYSPVKEHEDKVDKFDFFNADSYFEGFKSESEYQTSPANDTDTQPSSCVSRTNAQDVTGESALLSPEIKTCTSIADVSHDLMVPYTPNIFDSREKLEPIGSPKCLFKKDSPESTQSTSEVFVHSISQSFSMQESPAPAKILESEDLTYFYLTEGTKLNFEYLNPLDCVKKVEKCEDELLYYYPTPPYRLLLEKVSACLYLLGRFGRDPCLTAKCGVVLHGTYIKEHALMAEHVAHELQLTFIKAWCNFTNSTEVNKLYEEARKKSPSLVLVQVADLQLRDMVDGKPNTAVPNLLNALQTLKDSGCAVVTVCTCNKIERLSSKVLKYLGYTVFNSLPDAQLREAIIRDCLIKEHGYHLGSKVDVIEDPCNNSSSQAGEADIEQQLIKILTRIGRVPLRKTSQSSNESNGMENVTSAEKEAQGASTSRKTFTAEEVAALATATDYCNALEVLEVIHQQLMDDGRISGRLPQNFVPHNIRINGRGFVPPTRWSDISGYDTLKQLFQQMVRDYREDPELNPLQGLILYGPPGCSKTLFVRALVTETCFTHFQIYGSVILSKYVGETEQNLRSIVMRAKASAPSIVFIDELESLCGDRGRAEGGAHVALLLDLMRSCAPTPDDPRTSVLFVGATNMPSLIDEGLLQAGYLTRVVEVGLPSCASRCALWQRILKGKPCDPCINVARLCQLTRGFSGAEVFGVYQTAATDLWRRSKASGERPRVTQRLLEEFIGRSSPSTSTSCLASIAAFTASRPGAFIAN